MITDEMIMKYKETKDEKLFEEIYQEYVYFRIYLLGPISNKNDLEEINSNCDYALMQCIDCFNFNRKEAKFTTYLAKAIIHEKWSFYKKLKNKNDISMEYVISEDENLKLEDIIADDRDCYRELEVKEIKKLIHFQLSLLEEDERKIIEMYFLEEKSEKEIAKYFNVSQPTINKQKDDILHKMRRNIIIYNHK